MSTVNQVIYKIIKPHSEALAAFYQVYHIDSSKMPEKDALDAEYRFWSTEINLLPIPEEGKLNLCYDLNESISMGQYLTTFEDTILPIVLDHWSMDL